MANVNDVDGLLPDDKKYTIHIRLSTIQHLSNRLVERIIFTSHRPTIGEYGQVFDRLIQAVEPRDRLLRRPHAQPFISGVGF